MKPFFPEIVSAMRSPDFTPLYVAEIYFDATDKFYITSHPVSGLSGSNVFSGRMTTPIGVSQSIKPENFQSSIGTVDFGAVDEDLAIAALISSKDEAGKGIRQAKVKIYFGYLGISWADLNYSANVIATQVIDSVSVDMFEYRFNCSDPQRFSRKNIFKPAKTILTFDINETALLIPIASATGSSLSSASFERMFHGPTFSDAPGSEVGYVKIDNEIIRWNAVVTHGTYGLCFQVDGIDGRGVLGTRAAAHFVDESSSSSSKGKEVSEVIYLEMPAVEMIYGIYTGSYYSQPGKAFPTNWHLAVPSEYIQTSSFLAVGNDIWDGSTGGFIAYSIGEKEQDAKKFILEQICPIANVIPIVNSNGEIKLRRLNNVLHTSGYQFELDDSSVHRIDSFDLDYDTIANILSVEWNYEFLKEKTTRQKILVDTVSRAKYKDASPKKLQFRLLHGSRHTTTIIEQVFNRLRDRYAGPSYKMSITCAPWAAIIEVGDMIRLKSSLLNDPFTGSLFDRTLEVQSVRINYHSGDVTLELFGSSIPATVLQPSDPGQVGENPSVSVIPNSAYTALGTNIVGYAGANTTNIGGVIHITGGSGLVGGATIDSGRYYCASDMQLDSGVTLPFTRNCQVWVMGHLQINGIFEGSERGANGAIAIERPYNDSQPPYNAKSQWPPAIKNTGFGQVGLLSAPPSAGGVDVGRGGSGDEYYSNIDPIVAENVITEVPEFAISYSGNKIVGLPSILEGCGGNQGTNSRDTIGDFIGTGGNGGKSGAGIAFIARGISFGASGKVRVNGQDGALSSEGSLHGAFAGSGGGGANGAVIFIIDGFLSQFPDISNVEAICGKSPIPVGPAIIPSPNYVRVGHTSDHYSYFTSNIPIDRSGNGGAARARYAPPTNIPSEDIHQEAADAQNISVVEYTNTPHSPAANLSTLEISVTPPSPLEGYSYSNIYYRKYNSGQGWTYGCAASPEGALVVASDGTQYEIQARSVSKNGEENLTGITTSLYVSDVINPPATDNDIPKIVKVPDVTGLELSGLGNVTDFSGVDATIVWRRSSIAEWIGPIDAARLGSGALDQYFSHYEIIITDSATGEELHRATTTTPLFVYTLAMNEDDSKKLDAQKLRTYAGVRRSLGVAVRQYSRQGIRSTNDAYMVIRNPAPSDLTGILVKVGATSAAVTYDRPVDTDFIGVEVFMSTSSGFTPALANRIINGPDNSLAIYGLTAGTNYYLRFRPYDAYGQGNLSSEVGFTTGTITTSDVSGLSAWATRVTPADATFITAQLAADAIDSTKIANLAVGKLTAGVLNVTMTIQTTGSINVVNGIYTTKIGVHNVSGTDYAIRTSDGATSTFSVTAAGVLSATGAVISGSITITGGTGFANLADKPTSLSGINATEGTKLTGIQSNATATGSDNLVLNGDIELLSNKNFSQMAYSAPSSWAKVNHLTWTGFSGSIVSDLNFAVDPNYEYEMSVTCGVDAANTFYAGFACYDSNGNFIVPQDCYFISGTYTTAQAQALAGATTIRVVPSSTVWTATNGHMQVNATSTGSHLPTSGINSSYDVQISNVDTSTAGSGYWTVTLTAPLPQTINAGVGLANSQSSGTYSYFVSNNASNTVGAFQRHTGRITGVNDVNASPAANQFRIGTQFVKILFLPNRTTSSVFRMQSVSVQKIGLKLSGIADGATVGATWGTNLSSIPTELTDGRVTAALTSAGALRQVIRGSDLVAGSVATGLNMSSTRIGYYNGSTWPVYIANDGTFYFGSGGAANFIQWNGTTLTINGTLTIQSASGYANLTDRPTSLSGINSTEGTKLTGIAVGATKNTVTSGTTAPSSPTDGDVWVDTNAPVTIKTRIAGAWVSGGNIPTTLSQVNSSEGTKLSGVAVGATANIVSSGTLAARPTGANGDFYFATDNNILYQKISGAWVQSANNYTNTNQLTDGAGLGTTSLWTGVSGAGKPADNADVTQTAINATVTITGGGITMSAGGSIKGGKTAPGSGVGFFLGYSSGVYQLDVGDTANGKYMRFDGTDLRLGPKVKFDAVTVADEDDIYRHTPKWDTTLYSSTVTGNGTVAMNSNNSVRLGVGATAAVGTSQIISFNTGFFLNSGDWTKRRTLSIAFQVRIQQAVTIYLGLGQNADSALNNFCGVKIAATSINAYTQHSFSSNTQTTLISSANNNFNTIYKLKIIMEGGTTAYFYLNGTLVATHTLGVPSGGNFSQNFLYCKVAKTDAVANTDYIDIGETKFLQKE